MNKVISREYVEKNYIHIDKIKEKIKDCEYWADDYWEGTREELNYALSWLEELLEEAKDENISDRSR